VVLLLILTPVRAVVRGIHRADRDVCDSVIMCQLGGDLGPDHVELLKSSRKDSIFVLPSAARQINEIYEVSLLIFVRKRSVDIVLVDKGIFGDGWVRQVCRQLGHVELVHLLPDTRALLELIAHFHDGQTVPMIKEARGNLLPQIIE